MTLWIGKNRNRHDWRPEFHVVKRRYFSFTVTPLVVLELARKLVGQEKGQNNLALRVQWKGTDIRPRNELQDREQAVDRALRTCPRRMPSGPTQAAIPAGSRQRPDPQP